MKFFNKLILISFACLSLAGCKNPEIHKNFEVEFVNYDYSSLEKCVVKYGEIPSYSKEEPIKYDYEESAFVGWNIDGKFYSKDVSLPKIKKDTLIIASFNKCKERNWKDERDFTYINFLDKPESHVSNLTELSAIVDYYAFYKVEEFDVYLNNDYQYTFDDHDIDKEVNALYWYGSLVNGFMGINAKKTSSNCLHFVFTFYHENFETIGMDECLTFSNIAKADYDFSSTRLTTYNDFASENTSLKLCDVYSTNQLYYAIEHGYKPNCFEDSPAEKYYQKCKDLLIDIVDDKDSKQTKINKIYDYINNTSQYDYSLEEIQESPDPARYPDYYYSTNKTFYLEGYFDNHLCVCNSYSILFTILIKMEGIEIRRISACSSKEELSSKETVGHAYNYIKHDDDKWYYYDLTFGNSMFYLASNPVYMNLHYPFAASTYILDGVFYSPNDIEFDITDSTDYYYYENHYLNYEIDKKVDLYISTNDEAIAVANAINESLLEPYSYVELIFEDMYLEQTTLNLLTDFSKRVFYLDLYDETIIYRV